jgi:predicted naringenin-chalcone synthase
MSSLDILAFHALNGDQYLLRVTNAEFLDLVHARLTRHLTPAQVVLYEKLLQSDRTRYIAVERMEEGLDDDHLRRYARYRERCAALVRHCVNAIVADSGIDPTGIACVVTNTTVGGMVPNLSSLICNSLGLSPSTRVIDLGYMGCATALLGLELAEQQLRPGELGLVVSAELTSVMTNLRADNNASLIANTVFGDGVGAFLVARRPHHYQSWLKVLGYAGSVITDDDALTAITYEPNPVYHEIRLQETIGKVAARGVRIVLERLVREHLVNLADKLDYLMRRRIPAWQRRIDYAVLHTAGRRILDELTRSLSLEEHQTAHNHRAFQRYSNTSSASIYYALHELTRSTPLCAKQRLLFLGYGSGFLTRGLLVEVAV